MSSKMGTFFNMQVYTLRYTLRCFSSRLRLNYFLKPYIIHTYKTSGTVLLTLNGTGQNTWIDVVMAAGVYPWWSGGQGQTGCRRHTKSPRDAQDRKIWQEEKEALVGDTRLKWKNHENIARKYSFSRLGYAWINILFLFCSVPCIIYYVNQYLYVFFISYKIGCKIGSYQLTC